MKDKNSELVERKEVISDLAEILNNLNDDLVMSTNAEDGYTTHEQVVQAIKKYTLVVLTKKYKKYGGK